MSYVILASDVISDVTHFCRFVAVRGGFFESADVTVVPRVDVPQTGVLICGDISREHSLQVVVLVQEARQRRSVQRRCVWLPHHVRMRRNVQRM